MLTPPAQLKSKFLSFRSISAMMTAEDLEKGRVLPAITDVRRVSAQFARDEGFRLRADDERLQAMILNAMWDPKYLPYRYVMQELVY